MRSLEQIIDSDETASLRLRPLFLINKTGQIECAITSDRRATQAKYCWEALNCGAQSMRHCGAVLYAKSNSTTAGKTKSASGDGCGNGCVISPMTSPFSGSLVLGPQTSGNANIGTVLQSVAGLAGTFISRNLNSGVEIGLELIRFAVGADGCELFLADLHEKELLFAAGVGSGTLVNSWRARSNRPDRMSRLAFTQRHSINSRDGHAKSRLVSEQSDEAEAGSFICVPIPAPDGRTIGVINLTWQRSGVPVDALTNALSASAPSIGNAICAGYWCLRQSISEAAVGDAEVALIAMLSAVQEKSGADAGRLVMWGERDYKVKRVESFGASPPNCPWLTSPEAAPCSSRNTESCLRLVSVGKSHNHYPEPCRQMEFDGTVCCIPVTGGSTSAGRMLLGFRKDLPSPRVRPLVPMQVMIREMARHIPEPTVARPVIRGRSPQPLEIRCFGHFEVAIGKQNLPESSFQRRDAVTLLKILVLRAGRQVHRSKLIEWLWPETDERTGLNRLHGVVHALRNAIEPSAQHRNSHYLINEGDTYIFRPNKASIDLISFKEYLGLATRDLKKDGFVPNGVSYLERAVELYRGDLYENDEGSEWCDIERTALQREFVDALGTLARAYLTLGEGKRAMYALRRALAYDYSREDLHTELVRCLIRFRRHKEANEQICDCVRYLREELGVEPSAETQRLFHSLVK
jgi:two-component SAPR family response regulator